MGSISILAHNLQSSYTLYVIIVDAISPYLQTTLISTRLGLLMSIWCEIERGGLLVNKWKSWPTNLGCTSFPYTFSRGISFISKGAS
uniref:Uncharacterized protein n=1 Tax=Picea glauca TaxID=3330 RepID=A0A101LTN6_PICGL|nr:hypothetical protein ABT39_MTgene3619 [Picea glauca]KUM45147.1 hypothetical protein ABT39_MTgene3620 [Picea glauca]KUM51068.1 hypothetical protein ABT39_MTgene914 [Picea glauca]